MPELTFTVRWPDGRLQDCWSPSLVVHDRLAVDTPYAVSDLVRRADLALDIASDRVREKFGFACTGAADTVEQLARSAAAYDAAALVTVVRMHPTSPAERR